MSDELQTEINQARERGQVAAANEPRAINAWYGPNSHNLYIELADETIVRIPRQKLPALQSATVQQLAQVEITPSGYGLHWPDLDVDLAVPELVLDYLADWTAPPTAHQNMQKEQN
jgi:hypothetical protein